MQLEWEMIERKKQPIL